MIGSPPDTRLPIEVPQTEGMSREELRGRSSGVMVGAVFGVVWAASALSTLGFVVAVPVLVASAAIFAVLMTGSRRLRLAATALPPSTLPPSRLPAGGLDLDKVRRQFTFVVVIEAVAIFAAARILAESGHTQWIPAAICAVVGLHFVPLARLFRVGLYNATAVALCLVAAVTMVLGAVGAPSQLWQLLPGFGAALALWATGARLLVTAKNDKGDAMNWTRFANITMKVVVVVGVFVVGFLINGATMGIALGSGAAAAVFVTEGTTRCWPRKAHHPRSG